MPPFERDSLNANRQGSRNMVAQSPLASYIFKLATIVGSKIIRILAIIYAIKLKLNDDKYWRSNQRKIKSVIASARIVLLPTVAHKLR